MKIFVASVSGENFSEPLLRKLLGRRRLYLDNILWQHIFMGLRRQGHLAAAESVHLLPFPPQERSTEEVYGIQTEEIVLVNY
jgi:hypothetical protein